MFNFTSLKDKRLQKISSNLKLENERNNSKSPLKKIHFNHML
jgi:hypothetical protein